MIHQQLIQALINILDQPSLQREEEEYEDLTYGDMAFIFLLLFKICPHRLFQVLLQESFEGRSSKINDFHCLKDQLCHLLSPLAWFLLEEVNQSISHESKVGLIVQSVDVLLHHESHQELDDP